VGRVLVLNASFEPLSLISVQRAVVLLLREKAEAIENDVSRQLRAERISLPMPLVIRQVHYVPIPRRLRVPLTRKTLLSRDEYTCQFCGTTQGPLTVDHVIPRSRGGQTSWENCVAACLRCNHKKGNRLPEEIGMHLRRKPARPDFTLMAFVILGEARHNEVFQRYVY
jgi:5-methylcytosine-specific restriction endonuclease McrA